MSFYAYPSQPIYFESAASPEGLSTDYLKRVLDLMPPGCAIDFERMVIVIPEPIAKLLRHRRKCEIRRLKRRRRRDL